MAGKDLAFLNLYKTSHPETIVEGLRDLTRKVSQEARSRSFFVFCSGNIQKCDQHLAIILKDVHIG